MGWLQKFATPTSRRSPPPGACAEWRQPRVLNLVNLLTAMQICNTYQFVVWHADARSQPVRVGNALYQVASVFNHSCVPNADWSMPVTSSGASSSIVIRAARPLMKGEQVFISYIQHSKSYQHRRRALRAYGFRCPCERCLAKR
jgi:hypothetical protein